ncbi:MAG TPA: LysM peptidoglycan-binding domain-containing protein [Chryseolinea sp.]|nr:LysM peptidoglycan-binding domain-containing protein [Chryseolinea sp.]
MRLTLALFFVAFSAAAQPPEVPHKMDFAGMTLTIRDDARREIQKDVNALTQSPRHHMIKVERARTYFPLIEKVFAEEQVPDDFKYLVLQESALIADAVSVSNAVGFWQFKDFTAMEMGLRVDKEIDERLNIVSSTRAAGRYIKKNNTFFNNWVYALQAYQMGAGGVMRSVSKDENGKKSMEITSNTYWYVKKFLAHKIAFESSVGSPGQIKVVPYVNSSDKQLKDLAREVSVDELELMNYNKWAKRGTIPGDRAYTVIIPMKGEGIVADFAIQPVSTAVAATASAARPVTTSALKGRTKVNGISAIRPEPNETPAALASRAGVNVSDFAKWNDISSSDRLQTDTYYLLGKKRVRATTSYHTSETGEDLWKISQRYGVQLKKLKRYNRMSGNESLKPGTTVWLSSMKPKNAPNTAHPSAVTTGPIAQVEDNNSFSWAVDPSASTEVMVDEPSRVTQESNVTQERAPGTEQSSKISENTPASSGAEEVVMVTASPESPYGELENTATPSTATGDKVAETTADPTSTIGVGTTNSGGAPLIPPTAEGNSVVVTTFTPPDSVGDAKTAAVSLAKGKETHTVKTGETLYGIARDYGVGVMELVDWNGLNLQEGIRPGQVLKLGFQEQQSVASVAPTASEHTLEHVVRSTDTLYSVARKYNVTIKELMDWNNKKDFSLAIGEKLIVKGR